VRSTALGAHRWPWLAAGVLLVVLGGLWSWLLFLARGALASDQRRLDAGPTLQVAATVVAVDPPLHAAGQAVPWPDGIDRSAVHYAFRYRDQTLPGSSFAPLGQFALGQQATVELLPEEPNRNRLVGSLVHLERPWLQPEPWFVATVVPGALLLLGWLASAFQLRAVLMHGDAAVATVLTVRPVRWLLPQMLEVRFAFRDHRARDCRGRHWVRVHGSLGQRLLAAPAGGQGLRLPLLHDRRFPQWHRLALPEAFARTAAAPSTSPAP
jgi:hypothetical protein